MSLYYRLNPDHSVTPTDLEGSSGQWTDPGRVIGKDLVGGFEVSTVFLVIDHSFGGGGSQLFETMIFGAGASKYEEYQVRYETWDEAKAGHDAAVYAISNDLSLP